MKSPTMLQPFCLAVIVAQKVSTNSFIVGKVGKKSNDAFTFLFSVQKFHRLTKSFYRWENR